MKESLYIVLFVFVSHEFIFRWKNLSLLCRLIFATPPNSALLGRLEVFFLSYAKRCVLYCINNQFVMKV